MNLGYLGYESRISREVWVVGIYVQGIAGQSRGLV